MEAILNLDTGQNALYFVDKELKTEQGLAPILLQLMVVQIVSGKRIRHEAVYKMTAQV
jgi:hypothetical protein